MTLSALYLTLHIYSYEDLGTGVPRRTRISGGMPFSEGIHNKRCIFHGIRHNDFFSITYLNFLEFSSTFNTSQGCWQKKKL